MASASNAVAQTAGRESVGVTKLAGSPNISRVIGEDKTKITRAIGRGVNGVLERAVGPGVIVEARGPAAGGSPSPGHGLDAKFTQC